MAVLKGGRILRGKISREVMKSQSSLEGINVVLSGRTELVRGYGGMGSYKSKTHTFSAFAAQGSFCFHLSAMLRQSQVLTTC